ncbi:MAG TPA: DUF3606 domain-containing protein [Bacteroidia bacterium]|nr:DUF3606 domain-containing protein [Bacteroidia bacterium]
MLFVFKTYKTILHLFNGKSNTYNDSLIHLEDNNNVNYWLERLGVNKEKLNDAILYTGSINIGDIKAYLKKQI